MLPMSRRGDFDTLSLDVFSQLRSDILSGRIPPGERLKPTHLRERFDVSVGVVREALTRLTEQNLATGEYNKGFRVVSLTYRELVAITAARVLNECAALRTAIEIGDLTWETNVVAAHHRMVSSPPVPGDSSSYDVFAEAHKNFHFALLDGCQNPYMIDICSRLFAASEIYRRWSAPQIKHRNAAAEHLAIMETSLARKADEAVEHYRQHIQLTSDLIEELLQSQGDPVGG
jgi:DNA-binding GntR family transcriptional regulator